MKRGVTCSLIGWYRRIVHPEMVGMWIAALVVRVGHDDMGPLLPDEADEGPDCLLEGGGSEGTKLTTCRHVRVPIAEHPHPLIAEMRCRHGQFLAADLRETGLYLRAIERRIYNSAGLPASAADERCTHTGCGIARYATPAFGSFVVRMGMNGQQATRARTRITSDAEYLGLRSIGEVAAGHRRLVLLGIG